jgi:hypothetical protein
MKGPFNSDEAERFRVLETWAESLSYEQKAQLEELYSYRLRLHDYYEMLDNLEAEKLLIEAGRIAERRMKERFPRKQ